MAMKEPLSVFISYSHNEKDRPLLDAFRKHLAPLEQNGFIKIWEDAKIQASDKWEQVIMQQLGQADIVILLVSSDYLASKFVEEHEVPLALKRHEEGACKIVPVLLRECLYGLTSYAQYEFLPKDPADKRLKPVDQWDNSDRPLAITAASLLELVKHINSDRNADKDRKKAEDRGMVTDSGKHALRDVVRNLNITAELSNVHLVNCNRQDERDRFAQGFEEREGRGDKNHYYFISACPTQMPPSVGERMIHELLGELMDKRPDAVFRQTNEGNNDRIILEPLKPGYNLTETQKMFKCKCARLFKWDESTSFEDGLNAGKLPLPKYEYAILPFFIQKSAWKDFMPDFFRWVMEQFDKRTGGPKCLFFFVVYHEKLHLGGDDKSAAIIGSLDKLCEQYFEKKDPDCISKGHLHPLYPVSVSDLNEWLTELGENNPARRRPVLDTLVSNLPPDEKEQYQKEQTFNMDRVELVQEVVFEHYNK